MEPLSPLEESDEGGDTESSAGDTFSQSHSHNNNSNHSSISNSNNTGSSERRKLSLGVILRKLSSGSQHQPAAAAKERKTSLQVTVNIFSHSSNIFGTYLIVADCRKSV